MKKTAVSVVVAFMALGFQGCRTINPEPNGEENVGKSFEQAVGEAVSEVIVEVAKEFFIAVFKAVTSASFENHDKATNRIRAKMTIPASMTNITEGAFAGCRNLKEFEVSPDNAHLKANSGLLLTKDGTTLLAAGGGLTQATIPPGVTKIGNAAFKCCFKLTQVMIPAGVTSIGDRAFEHCHSLTNVTIPAGVTNIGKEAFFDCSKLACVRIPASVTNIGDGVFGYCNLKELVVAEWNPRYFEKDGYLCDRKTGKKTKVGEK